MRVGVGDEKIRGRPAFADDDTAFCERVAIAAAKTHPHIYQKLSWSAKADHPRLVAEKNVGAVVPFARPRNVEYGAAASRGTT
jgi:hypothetical protein